MGSPEDLSIDGPVASYRLAQIRDGLEDWELFSIAEDLGAGDYARTQVERAYRQFGTAPREDCDDEGAYCPDDPPWTLDQQVLLDARWNVAAKVAHLMDPDAWPDPEDTSDTAETGSGTVDGCQCGSRTGTGWAWLAGLLLAGSLAARRRGL